MSHGLSPAGSRVRPATIEDVPGLVALAQALDLGLGAFSGRPPLDTRPEHLARRFTEIISNVERYILVAVDDAERAIGMLAARRDDLGLVDPTPVLHVTHLRVAAEHRRRGIGRALLAAAVHLAEELGVDHVLSGATSTSREGNRYLARLGFAPVVMARLAPTSGLRRTLGMTDAAGRVAVLRRARLRGRRAELTARARRA